MIDNPEVLRQKSQVLATKILREAKGVQLYALYGLLQHIADVRCTESRRGGAKRPKAPAPAKRKISKEVRKKLSKLAKERWKAAKKAGKTKLGS